MPITRRQFSQGLATGGAGLALLPHAIRGASKQRSGQAWQALLGTNLTTEYDYQPAVEGSIPAALKGTLYRNGPGLFTALFHGSADHMG